MNEVNIKEYIEHQFKMYDIQKPKPKIPLDYFTIKYYVWSVFVTFFSWFKIVNDDVRLFTKYMIMWKTASSDSCGWFEEGIFFYDEHEDETFEDFIRKKVELEIHSCNLPEFRALLKNKKEVQK